MWLKKVNVLLFKEGICKMGVLIVNQCVEEFRKKKKQGVC